MGEEFPGERVEARPLATIEELFARQQASQDAVHEARQKHALDMLAFAAMLGKMTDERLQFKGTPTSHACVRISPDGNKAITTVPCYSLTDQEMKPIDYQGCKVIETQETNQGWIALVTYPTWGEDYEIVPLSTITDFSVIEELIPAG